MTRLISQTILRARRNSYADELRCDCREGQDEQAEEVRKARTLSWAAAPHFLLVTVEGRRMTVRPIAELGQAGALSEIRRLAPDKSQLSEPIVINLS